jgi:hypothetical protein
MKLDYINDIAETSNEFMYKVIDSVGCLEYDELMKRIDNVCNACTEHSDDTIDIDFKNMCFTVHKDNVLGMWHLCENASYYIYKNGFLDEVDGIIDVELF